MKNSKKKTITKTKARNAAPKPAKAPKTKKSETAAATKKPACKPKSKTVKRKQALPAKKRDIFAGAKEVAITENKIAVIRTVSENVNGRYEKREVREYHDKTPANMAALDRKLSSAPTKKVCVKCK